MPGTRIGLVESKTGEGQGKLAKSEAFGRPAADGIDSEALPLPASQVPE